MAQQTPPPDERDDSATDSGLARVFARILIVEALVVGGLYWMSRYFA